MAETTIQTLPVNTVLETSRCCLRYPQMSDAQRAFSAFVSPFFPKLLPLGQISSLEETRNWIKNAQTGWAAGDAYTWSIDRRVGELMVGQVTLTKLPDPDRWSLAFWIHPEHWGEGYATEAARKVLEFAFERLGAVSIWAGAGMWNQASASVLNKLGMTHIADNPEGYTIDDKPVPTWEYEITRDVWRREREAE